MPTATETQTSIFQAKDPNYRLVRVPMRRRYNERGEQENIPGLTYEFENGVLRTDDPDVIDWLRNHEQFNAKFWEMGNEPGREKPSVEEQVLAITDAAGRGDAERIAEIYDAESANHRREVVLKAAESALTAISAAAALTPSEEGSQAPTTPENAPEG